MGGGRWDARAWDSYATKTYVGKSTEKVFTKKKMKDEFDPKNIVVRESRDSADNPMSTPIILGLDVTGSMHYVIDKMAREGMPKVCQEIYDRRPITDPHIMCMGIGDVVARDDAPLQCTQFEADIRISEQINDIWLEGGGGGNRYEGYNLPWYFAAMKTEIDCFEKRGQKGYLFTIGDEFPPEGLSSSHLRTVFGPGQYKNMSNDAMLKMVQRKYHVFHVIVEEGHCAKHHGKRVEDAWRKVLGQNVIPLSDHTKLAETVVSTLQVVNGVDHKVVEKSWDGSTSVVVQSAIRGLKTVDTVEDGIVTL